MTIYESTTNRILEQLNAGVVPWRKTWATGLPKNLVTGREFRGVNIVVLGTTSFASRYWLTQQEAQRVGGHVRDGEQATPVIHWHWRTEEELNRLRDETGKQDIAPGVPIVSAVFNLDQTEGIRGPEEHFPQKRREQLDLADQLWSEMPERPEIVHQQVNGPSYQAGLDRVILPNLSQFESAEQYYGALFDGLVRSTGHANRLNRSPEGSPEFQERYGFEELVAEFGAAFLLGAVGMQPPVSQEPQASYIAGWATAFRQDNQLLIRAASAAQKAVDYIRGQGPRAKVEPTGPGAMKVGVREQARPLRPSPRTSHGPNARRPERLPFPQRIPSNAARTAANRGRRL